MTEESPSENEDLIRQHKIKMAFTRCVWYQIRSIYMDAAIDTDQLMAIWGQSVYCHHSLQ